MDKEIIYVRHVNRTSAQGRHNYSFNTETGGSIPAGRTRAKGVTIPYGFPRDSETGYLITGLDEMIRNPWYQQELNNLNGDLKVGSHWVDRYDELKERAEIPKQTYFEILDNVAPNTYTNKANMPLMTQGLNADAFKSVSPTYLEEFKIYLKEGTNTFSADSQRGRLGIQVCKVNPRIAVNKEYNSDIHDFYIADIEEAIKEKNREIDHVMQGLTNLGMLRKNYPAFTSYQMAIILEIVRGDKVSDATIEMELKNYLWESKKTQKGTQDKRVSRFSHLFDILDSNKDKFYIEYLMQQALNTGVWRMPSGLAKIFWPSKKGIKNIYDLGTNLEKIKTMLLNEYEKYDPDIQEDNWFYELEKELKDNNVQCR